MLSTLQAIEKGQLVREAQDDDLMTYAPLMSKELAIVDWTQSTQSIHDLIRGFNPWPIATTSLTGHKMKLYKSLVTDRQSTGKPGQVVEVTKEGIYVSCLDRQLLLKEIQMPNKKRMTVEQYILGNEIQIGTILGE